MNYRGDVGVTSQPATASRYNDQANAVVTKTPRHVTDQLIDQDKALVGLADLVESLEGHLEPILNPPTEPLGKPGSTPTDNTGVRLAEAIRCHNERLSVIYTRISQIKDRLAI